MCQIPMMPSGAVNMTLMVANGHTVLAHSSTSGHCWSLQPSAMWQIPMMPSGAVNITLMVANGTLIHFWSLLVSLWPEREPSWLIWGGGGGGGGRRIAVLAVARCAGVGSHHEGSRYPRRIRQVPLTPQQVELAFCPRITTTGRSSNDKLR